MTRYNLRYGTTRIPMVEILAPHGSDRLVKRVYGFTYHHAYRRALSWVRKNGDPR